ncbi:MAG: hypothetical protein CM1200mP22_33250 [Dehalococcoidia bacterium]|nr:MAG: hypothetical protein CM1200mP22_33250 [Dehalococcoidia bacterium]
MLLTNELPPEGSCTKHQRRRASYTHPGMYGSFLWWKRPGRCAARQATARSKANETRIKTPKISISRDRRFPLVHWDGCVSDRLGSKPQYETGEKKPALQKGKGRFFLNF